MLLAEPNRQRGRGRHEIWCFVRRPCASGAGRSKRSLCIQHVERTTTDTRPLGRAKTTEKIWMNLKGKKQSLKRRTAKCRHRHRLATRHPDLGPRRMIIPDSPNPRIKRHYSLPVQPIVGQTGNRPVCLNAYRPRRTYLEAPIPPFFAPGLM